MGLFQQSVLNKYLEELDEGKVQNAYKRFKAFFHNPEIQENIRQSKEEQFQEGFLTALFVNVLGYTINPNQSFNLTTEFKNLRGAKKADGAILRDSKALGVIELKSTKTKNLEAIRQQAFDYKANHVGCVYVITSNFEKVRFYINNAVDYEEFDLFGSPQIELFSSSFNRFKLLYLCLSKESLLRNIPLKIKEASIQEEESITKKFYGDYSLFKRELYRDLVRKNMNNSELRELAEKSIKKTLFKKSQKLIDRFLFIFFAEDRGLLPPNTISKVLDEWETLKEMDEYTHLYNRYKKYFGYLDTGREGKDFEVFAYNGGLFEPDAILDSIEIDDELLFKHTSKLSKYDFKTDVDVNILGHIFENSLNEIESINAEIEGIEFEKQKAKRKKEGIFYTPKYITKYIVDDTVGKLCEEKKKELGVLEEEYLKSSKGRKKETIQDLNKKLEQYREWLLDITICDPACGSGAFLHQALDFLVKEHRYIGELQAKLFGKPYVFHDFENHILERNIYGVDINEESVEIAKLSLWLHTAQKGRKLTTLSNNIKCGNSLINSATLAGEKAFKWEKEFPEVFANNGFDVVIGNPPYVRQELVKEYSNFLERNFFSFSGKADLYVYFYEQGVNLLKEKGIISLISSGKFFEASYGKPLLDFLVKSIQIIEVINFGDLEIFQGISAYPLIFTAQKSADLNKNYTFNYSYVPKLEFNLIEEVINDLPDNKISYSDFIQNDYKFYSKETSHLISTIQADSKNLRDINCLPLVGVKTGFNDGFITENKTSACVSQYIFGKNLKRYLAPQGDTNIIFPYKKNNSKYELVTIDELENVREQLESNKEKLTSRAIIKDGVVNNTKKWYEYQQINRTLDFNYEYIVYPNVSLGSNFTLSRGNVIDMTGFIIPSNDKSLLAILNSKLVRFLMGLWAITRRGGYHEYKVQYLEKIPIKEFDDSTKKTIIGLVDKIFQDSNEYERLRIRFLDFLMASLSISEVQRKLQSWHKLKFGEFIKELNKVIKKTGGEKLSKKDEIEWMELFEDYKHQAQQFQSEIDKTDKEIDRMVYELYELTEEEIELVENSL